MAMKVLILLPECDYDPTESSLPWKAMQQAGYSLTFTTPEGKVAAADTRLTDKGFSLLSPFLMTRKPDISVYFQMAASPEFQNPVPYDEIIPQDFDALLIPGGHAPGMKTMMESSFAHTICRYFMDNNLPLAAVCHGVLVLCRAKGADGLSLLNGRHTTALPASMELSAWAVTLPWLGNYYRTYPTTVEAEVKQSVGDSGSFNKGPFLPLRDSAESHRFGFTVRDGNYLSARWPGDCNKFSAEWVELLQEHKIRASFTNKASSTVTEAATAGVSVS